MMEYVAEVEFANEMFGRHLLFSKFISFHGIFEKKLNPVNLFTLLIHD